MQLQFRLVIRNKDNGLDLFVGEVNHSPDTEVKALRLLHDFCAEAIANAERDKIFKPLDPAPRYP